MAVAIGHDHLGDQRSSQEGSVPIAMVIRGDRKGDHHRSRW